MLRLLRIRNLAVIEAAEVEFEPGFNVLTGETGAGKSILVEAVGLLLGARASADLVRTGETQATIEAIFERDGRELLVRREVTTQGRSRSSIDGALATSAALRELAQGLVELHGQHEHQGLLDPQTHLPLLDQAGGLEDLVRAVSDRWKAMQALREQRDRLRMDAREKSARLDLIAYQLGEIEKAAPVAGEDEELTAMRLVLANAEHVRQLSSEAYALLYERDEAVLANLGQAWKRVAELAVIDPQFVPYLEQRDAIKSQLEDLSQQLRQLADGVDASPARLQQVEDRLALLERLKRKYGPTLGDVTATGERLRRERHLLGEGEQAAQEVDGALADASEAYLADARELSRRRRAAAKGFAATLESLLRHLAMAEARFEVRFAPDEPGEQGWSEAGVDRAEFYLSPNPGEELRPLARIVSGGELSRVMLALKTMGADEGAGRTLVFDEVDAGIGGRVADVVGTRLRELGRRSQVICITHLAQIAAQADSHFRIEKAVRGRRTVTTVHALDDDARVEELGRMIAGTEVGQAARASARELLARPTRAKGKQKAKGESKPG